MTAPARQRNAIETLRHHHPLVIEGMGGYDTRDPYWVASVIVDQLTARWSTDPLPKPVLLITQGDPYERKGIAAITRLVADAPDVPRALVFLDPHIADYHAPNADRYKVTCEIAYSELVTTLRSDCPGLWKVWKKGLAKFCKRKTRAAKPPVNQSYGNTIVTSRYFRKSPRSLVKKSVAT